MLSISWSRLGIERGESEDMVADNALMEVYELKKYLVDSGEMYCVYRYRECFMELDWDSNQNRSTNDFFRQLQLLWLQFSSRAR